MKIHLQAGPSPQDKSPGYMKRTPLRSLVGILIIYLLLGTAYILSNPLLESPDELLNYGNMRVIAAERQLPVATADELSKAHHPPLYYLLGAAVTAAIPADNLDAMAENINPYFGYRTYEFGVDNKNQYLFPSRWAAWPWQDAALGLYLMRFLSLAMGAGGVAAVWATAGRLFAPLADDRREWLAAGAAAVVALNPMFLFIQGSVHNDALTNPLAAGAVWAVVRYWDRPTMRRAAVVGLICALGILTKITFLFVGPMVAAAMLVRRWGDWRAWGRDTAVGGGLVLALSGWWFVRNQILYGEPTSMELQASVWQPRPGAPDWAAAVGELDYLRDSFWGVFGFGQIVFPRPVYTLWAVLVAAAVLGLAWRVWRGRQLDGRLTAVLLILPATALAATFSRMAVSATANFGRYLFTGYAVIAPLLVWGWTAFVPQRWTRAAVLLLGVGLVSLNGYGLMGVLRPVYTPPPRLDPADLPPIPHPVEVRWQNGMRLHGYAPAPNEVRAGAAVDVTLYWQTAERLERPLTEFVQLVSTADNERLTGRDTYPGLGRYPTDRWRPDEIVVDRVPVYAPAYARCEPGGLRLDVGWKDPAGNAIPTENGLQTVTVGLMRQAPQPVGLDCPQVSGPPTAVLGEIVHLAEISGAPTEPVAAGAALDVRLVWQAQARPTIDYTVFVHLLDAAGELAAQYDGPPKSAVPTTLWRAGDVVVDERDLVLPADLPAGAYTLAVGWYRPGDFARLPLTVDGERQPQDAFRIPVTVGE